MEKPVYLRTPTYDFLARSMESMTDEQLQKLAAELGYGHAANRHTAEKKILDEPAAFLLKIGILDMPDLLRGSVIQFDDDVEYLVSHAAADALKAGEEIVILTRLADGRGIAASRKRIEEAMEGHCEFDQLNEA
jgi:hypothetical protein